MGFIMRWLVTFLAVLAVSYLGKDSIIAFKPETDWLRSAAIFSLVLGLLNAFVRPVLGLLTLPLTIITLGLFSLVLNLLMFGLAAWLVPGTTIPNGLLGLIIASVLVSIVGSVIGRILDVR
jgi:putative membrane protein